MGEIHDIIKLGISTSNWTFMGSCSFWHGNGILSTYKYSNNSVSEKI